MIGYTIYFTDPLGRHDCAEYTSENGVESVLEEFKRDFGSECVVDAVETDCKDYDDSMDGDFDSAMASAGFGMDEDYGYAGDML